MALFYCKYLLVALYLFVVLMIINPLSRYWTFLSYQFKYYSIIDYPIHKLEDHSKIIAKHCLIHSYLNNDRSKVYDCTKNPDSNQATIAIAAFHHFESIDGKLNKYEQLILSNHIGYAMKHNYLYFDINHLIFNDSSIEKYFESTIPTANAIFKAQKPFIIDSILSNPLYADRIDYILWIDFDAIFYNCTTSIQSVIEYTHNLYAHSSHYNAMDIIFCRDYFSMTNSGVIIYKNTKWTKQILKKQMFVFENANKFQYASIYKHIRTLVDQNIFNALMMGFDPLMNDNEYLMNGNGYFELAEILKYEQETHELIKGWHSWEKCLVDEQQYVHIHDNWLGENVRNHTAMIPQFYLNVIMGEWIYASYGRLDTFPYDPIIVHFASSIGKPYLSSPLFKELKCSVDDFT